MSEDWIQRFQNSEKKQYINDLILQKKDDEFTLSNEQHCHQYTREHKIESYFTQTLHQPCVMFRRETCHYGTEYTIEWIWLIQHPNEGLCQLFLDVEEEGVLTSYFWLKGRTLPKNGFSRRLTVNEFNTFPSFLEDGIKESLRSHPRYRLPLVYRDEIAISYTKKERYLTVNKNIVKFIQVYCICR